MKSDKSPTLPTNWARTTIGMVADEKVPQNGPAIADTFTYVDIGSIDNQTKRIVDAKSLSRAEAPSRAKQHLETDDVLVSMTRPNLNAVAIVPPELNKAIGSTGFDVLRSHVIDPSWLFYMVQTNEFIHAMCQVVQGALYPAIRPNNIRSYSLPIAPLNEQRRIVAKIEELFSDLDAGVAALERAKANLKRYRAAVLKAAVEGKLTESWRTEHPNTEPASKLLARILTERRQKWESTQLAKFTAAGKEPPKGWREKYIEPLPPDMTDIPEFPASWTIASQDQLSTTITSGSRDWSQYYGEGTGTFIMAQNVRPGRLDLSFRQAVNPPADDRDRVRSQVANGDLLVTIVGANTGDVCRVDDEYPEHYVCQSVALMRPVVPVVSKFAEAYFTSHENGQRQFRRYVYGQGRPHLGFDQLRVTPVLLPPLAEQAEIVAAISEKLSQIEAAEVAITHGLLRAARLRQSILKQAFEGKLVPQDPNDEPASVLLERLRANRSAHEGNGNAASQPRTRGRRAKSPSSTKGGRRDDP